MSNLLGAWSLSNTPVSRRLCSTLWSKMTKQLPDHAKLRTLETDRAWLVAPANGWVRDASNVLAVEGYVASNSDCHGELTQLLHAAGKDHEDAKPEGHYVLCHLCFDQQRLTLVRSLLGGERLYYARLGDVVLFASSAKPLTTHPDIGRRLHEAKIGESLLTGLTVFGNESLFCDIREVQPGHRLTIHDGELKHEWHWRNLLAPVEGDLESLARDFRQRLGDAVSLAIGTQKRVAVTCSGGIDSAAITALAVESVGASNVDVFTYEFDDLEHPSETHYAREVCRRLGIARHHVFKVSFEDFLSAIPETVWRAEHFAHWPKAWMLKVTRYIQQAGFDRYLSGFGIGSHMGQLTDIAAMLRWLPAPELVLKIWKLARSRKFHWLEHAEHVVPGLATPNFRQYLLVLSVLKRHDVIRDVSAFYPARTKALVDLAMRAVPKDQSLDDTSLFDTLATESFAQLASCVDVTRWEKVLREVGTHRISPAHFASCLPYAYMPVDTPARQGRTDAALRPGKLLLKAAMRDTLPASVLNRKKSWADAVISPRWQAAGVSWMRRVIPRRPDYLGITDEDCLRSIRYWNPRAPQASVTALAFWHQLFIAGDQWSEPPTWLALAERSMAMGNTAWQH